MIICGWGANSMKMERLVSRISVTSHFPMSSHRRNDNHNWLMEISSLTRSDIGSLLNEVTIKRNTLISGESSQRSQLRLCANGSPSLRSCCGCNSWSSTRFGHRKLLVEETKTHIFVRLLFLFFLLSRLFFFSGCGTTSGRSCTSSTRTTASTATRNRCQL